MDVLDRGSSAMLKILLLTLSLFSSIVFAEMDKNKFEDIRLEVRNLYSVSREDALALCDKHLIENKGVLSQSQIIALLNYKVWFSIELGKHEEAIFILSEMKSRIPKSDFPFLLYAYNNSTGGLYSSLELYEEALTYHLKAYDMAKNYDDEEFDSTRFIYQSMNNIAEVYIELERYDEAVVFLLSYLGYLDALPSKNHLSYSIVLGNLSLAYLGNNKLVFAKKYANKALAIQNEHGLSADAAYSHQMLGKIFIAEKKYQLAEAQLELASQIFAGQNLLLQLHQVKLELSHIYTIQERYDAALMLLKSALEYAISTNKLSLIVKTVEALKGIYQTLGQFSNAFEVIEYQNDAQFKIQARQNKVSLAQAQAQVDLAHKDLQIDHLHQDKLLQNLQQKSFKSMLVLVSIFVLAIIIFLIVVSWHIRRKNQMLANTIELLQKTQLELIESEKMASLGSLVAGVAHEINTPVGLSLTGVSYLEHTLTDIEALFIAEELEEAAFEKFIIDAQKITKTMSISLKRAANLVKSFKLVAVDQSHEALRTFDIVEYLNETILTLGVQTKSSGIKFDTEHDVDSLDIKSFPGSWAQVFTNLLQNAIIHAFNTEQPACVSLKLYKQDNELIFICKDNGIGMDQDVQERIFEPFFTTNRENGGSGLGLHIIYNIITQKFKGNISVESKLGHGTKFIVKVPLYLTQ
jgi:signal transduction histidine kinase